MPAFIETQFPIARLSAESYKERKANNSQTLTRLGKWWGRKPLILIRASLLGMIMPASGNPKRDREIFLKILTMDDAGTLARWRTDKRFVRTELEALATPDERARWLNLETAEAAAKAELDDRKAALKRIPRSARVSRAEAQGAVDAAQSTWGDCMTLLSSHLGELQVNSFSRLSYAERIARCERPENVAGPTAEA